MALDLDWDGCFAIRDLGGLQTQSGITASRVFVRGDNARNLTTTGWKQAWDYGIRSVLDLRSETECAGDPELLGDFFYRRISLFAHFDDDPEYHAEFLSRVGELGTASKYHALYAEALDLDRNRFAEAFSVLARAPEAVFFHCVGGKDRTGVLAALLLRLLQVSMGDVEADFIHTEIRALGGIEAPHIDSSAPAGVVTQVIGEVEDRCGSVSGYLLDAGVSADDLAVIAEKFAHTAA